MLFRSVSTSGVPTPGGDGFHKAYKYPFVDNLGSIEEILLHNWKAESGILPEYAAVVLKSITSLVGQSMWNDWGSGFVPNWSGQAKNVALFNNGKADVQRWNVPFDYSGINIDGVHTLASFSAIAFGESIIGKLPWDNPATKALRYFGYLTIGHVLVKACIDLGEDIINFAGFHGGMVDRKSVV